jgi:hypothetical protein
VPRVVSVRALNGASAGSAGIALFAEVDFSLTSFRAEARYGYKPGGSLDRNNTKIRNTSKPTHYCDYKNEKGEDDSDC